MKRLTMKDENGCFLTDKTATVTWNSLIGENRYRGEAVDRFAAIEDILGDEYELDRLRELVEVRDTLKEFAEDVARQFGYRGTTPDGRAAYTAGGLSTLEWAWSLLGWPDPKPAPDASAKRKVASSGRTVVDQRLTATNGCVHATTWLMKPAKKALNAREQND